MFIWYSYINMNTFFLSHRRYFSSFLPSLLFSIFLFSSFLFPSVVSAHEVYVLSPSEVQTAINTPSVDPMSVVQDQMTEFSLYALIGALLVFCIFFISISRWLEKKCDPFLMRIKKYAPLIGRMAMGLSFICAAYFGAIFGPELPLHAIYGSMTPVVQVLLCIVGLFVIAGFEVQIAATIALVLYLVEVYYHGVYMLTYVNYLGEVSMLLFVGAGSYAIQKTKLSAVVYRKIEHYGFLASRVLFGTALIFSSSYAKIIHSNLGLETVMKYHLTNYLHFEPHFLVLGAGLVEITIGLFFIFGIEIRFTSVFLLFWLTLSLLFFGEVVWPHLILIGIPLSFFCYGYDQYSLEGYFFKRLGREPVL